MYELYIFAFLTIMHPIADFGTPIRKWGKGWKQFFVSEWFLSFNPFHALWDSSSLRQHHKYIEPQTSIWVKSGVKESYSESTTMLVHWWFWRWLAVDQVYHMITNLIWALWLGSLL